MRSAIACAFTLAFLASSAAAQDEQLPPPDQYDFQGGTFVITTTAEYERILTYDGEELARNFHIGLDRMANIAGVEVAIFYSGDGGNMCTPATLIVWKPEGEGVRTDIVGEECGSPSAAVTSQEIFFVPYVLPGATGIVEKWTPEKGLSVIGRMGFAPQPGTGWQDLDPSAYMNIVDALSNEAVYGAARKLLGNSLNDVITGLLVGGGVEWTPSGAFYASGCVPHSCGMADGFMAVDPGARRVYFAQKTETPTPNAWPALSAWPEDIRDVMESLIAGG